MRRALRYAVSLFVGLLVTASVAEFSATDHLLTISLFPLYVAVSSMIAHRRTLISLSLVTPLQQGSVKLLLVVSVHSPAETSSRHQSRQVPLGLG